VFCMKCGLRLEKGGALLPSLWEIDLEKLGLVANEIDDLIDYLAEQLYERALQQKGTPGEGAYTVWINHRPDSASAGDDR